MEKWSGQGQTLQICVPNYGMWCSNLMCLCNNQIDPGDRHTPFPLRAVPLFWESWRRCCQKLRKGAMPVPGPTRMQGWEGSSGSWKPLTLQGDRRKTLVFRYPKPEAHAGNLGAWRGWRETLISKPRVQLYLSGPGTASPHTGPVSSDPTTSITGSLSWASLHLVPRWQNEETESYPPIFMGQGENQS